jgi:hypothetical protein
MRCAQGAGDEGRLPARQQAASGTYDNVIHGAQTRRRERRIGVAMGLKSRPGTCRDQHGAGAGRIERLGHEACLHFVGRLAKNDGVHVRLGAHGGDGGLDLGPAEQFVPFVRSAGDVVEVVAGNHAQRQPRTTKGHDLAGQLDLVGRDPRIDYILRNENLDGHFRLRSWRVWPTG